MKARITLISILIVFITGCASQSGEINKIDLYVEKSIEYFNDKKFSKAKNRFQKIHYLYQGTALGNEAQYYLGLCEYELNEFENAKQSFKEYIKASVYDDPLRVQHAEYKKCLCMFELTLSYKKDQNKTKKAIDSFQEFIEKYKGDKRYLADAQDKIQILREKLALKQYEAARLYIKTGQYESASLYLDDLLKYYRDTVYADDARIGHILILLINQKIEEAENFIEDNKNDFNSLPDGEYNEGESFVDKNNNGKWDIGEEYEDAAAKYNEAKSIIENSKNRKIKIKELYFIDYINKIL